MRLEIVMLSRLGRGDGGRETWAYGFIPRYLKANTTASVSMVGFAEDIREDPAGALAAEAGAAASNRLLVRLLPLSKGRVPFLAKMLLRMRALPPGDVPPDITLGVGGAFEMILILFGRKGPRGKVIIWLRGILTHEKADRLPRVLMPLARKIEEYLLRKADLLLANGDDIAEHYRQRGLNPIIVIKNSVDIEKWAMDPPSLNSPLKVAFIGRLAKVKGIEEFCRLVESVKASDHANLFEFVVVGDGPYRSAVESLAGRQLLDYRGHMSNSELPGVLASVDICVALTFSSPSGGGGGTSNALLEQMAAGRVILGWDNPHFRQLVDQHSAFLVAQGDVKALADALLAIANDRDAALNRAAVAAIEAERYGMGAQIAKFEAALHSIGIGRK